VTRKTATALATLLAALLALSLVAGCGGDSGPSKDEYAKGYKPINDEFVALGREVGTTVQTAKGQTDAALARKFSDQATQVGGLKARLEQLDPPDDYKSDHDKLVAAMGLVHADLVKISTTAGAHDAAGAKAATQKLFADSEQVRNPRRALAKKTGARTE
jgi:hypothetical protein